ncbi:alanine/glycine:cation symporter family protein [Fusibacter sp. JL216-2]|uniref:alanine/glycine:cation symporter family protein n=1 Tax=Fusibacter sp. JL216-2 TaxID=3071453 RepID=UPI003D342E2B
MARLVDFLNALIWSEWLIALCLGAGFWFTIRTKFLQVRLWKEMIHLMFQGKASEQGVSSFQALAISISGRVGIGNIAGVASAIAIGGPGAVFWMWVIAFLGASSAYVESALAQIYKVEQDGQYRGGPAYFIEKGMGNKTFAVVFAVTTVVSMGLFMPGIQANSIAAGLNNAFGIFPVITGVVLVSLLAAIVFGGVKRIGRVAEFIVPFMAAAYIFTALIIIFMNISRLPEVLRLIVESAFGLEPAFSGIIGMAIAWGVKRGVYSNEAGQGTGPHAAAAAEVSHPAKQGLVQAFSVYIDTLFVCSATAFMILITDMYNVENPIGGYLVIKIGDVDIGPAYIQGAVESAMPGFGAAFVGIALVFFAFTTLMAYYYIAETNIAYLNRSGKTPWLLTALRVVMLGATFHGAIKTADIAWGMGDVGVGLMAWLNIIAILLLQKPALLTLKDYEDQLKQGHDPEFSPRKLGIKHATWWENDNRDKPYTIAK